MSKKFDQHLINYIMSFLIECSNCKVKNLYGNKCCCCSKKFCSDCHEKKLKVFYGFFKCYYCDDCCLPLEHCL